MRASLVVPAVFSSFLWAGLCSAAPISITEPPDLPDSGGATYTLDVGTNTVTGAVSGAQGLGPDYQDNFSIFVPFGLQVTSTSLKITNFTNAGGAAGFGCFTIFGCFGTGLGAGLSNQATGSTVSYTATSPWASDNAGGAHVGSFTYVLTMEVAPDTSTVPEPSTVLLVFSALAAAALRRRR